MIEEGLNQFEDRTNITLTQYYRTKYAKQDTFVCEKCYACLHTKVQTDTQIKTTKEILDLIVHATN